METSAFLSIHENDQVNCTIEMLTCSKRGKQTQSCTRINEQHIHQNFLVMSGYRLDDKTESSIMITPNNV